MYKLVGIYIGISEFLVKILYYDMYIMGNKGNKWNFLIIKYIKNISKIVINKWRNGSKDLFYLYIFVVLLLSFGMVIFGVVVG